MSFDSFVILPAHVFKTDQRLAEYKEFFEPQLSDLLLAVISAWESRKLQLVLT